MENKGNQNIDVSFVNTQTALKIFFNLQFKALPMYVHKHQKEKKFARVCWAKLNQRMHSSTPSPSENDL
jgi:hypothetical protein